MCKAKGFDLEGKGICFARQRGFVFARQGDNNNNNADKVDKTHLGGDGRAVATTRGLSVKNSRSRCRSRRLKDRSARCRNNDKDDTSSEDAPFDTLKDRGMGGWSMV